MSALGMMIVLRMLSAWTMMGLLLACASVDTVVMVLSAVQVMLCNCDLNKGITWLLWLVHCCSTLSCSVGRSLAPLCGAYGLLVLYSLAVF